MDSKRRNCEGLIRVVRFNWHFYAIGLLVLMALAYWAPGLPMPWRRCAQVMAVLVCYSVLASLLTTYWVYDRSDLYHLNWLNGRDGGKVLNIHAGYDEISPFLSRKLPRSPLTVCDFYDPDKHTEISIQRARHLFPPGQDVIPVTTSQLPFENGAFDSVVVMMAAHEVRQKEELMHLFQELKRVTQDQGRIFITEHLRDAWNFMAYTAGFLHFQPYQLWRDVFQTAGLQVMAETKTTPFVTTFTLTKNGDTA